MRNFLRHGDEADEAAAGAGAEGDVRAVDVDGPGDGVFAFEKGVGGAIGDVEAEGFALVADGSGFGECGWLGGVGGQGGG